MSTRDTISRVVSHPRVFQLQTALLGGKQLAQAIEPIASAIIGGRPSGTVVDVGGGTASARSLWPDGWDYISIDPDPRVVGFDHPGCVTRRLVGDASKLGLRDHSLDVVLMKNVSHHLNDATWSGALSEVRRILKPDGWFLFVDGLWSRRRVVSRLGWALDAGRHPRRSDSIEGAIATMFDVANVERLTLLHDCIIVSGRPRCAALVAEAGPRGS
jgi:SAM-dependent methyltransferase